MLSFPEFKAIIQTRVPHFSDRRILRMFREALMGGADQSFALSMEAFVLVCGDHGLVSLLPDDRLQDPFLHQTKTKQNLKALVGVETNVNAADKKKPQDGTTPPPILELPAAGDSIPEELPFDNSSDDAAAPWPSTSRAEEVEDEDETWEW